MKAILTCLALAVSLLGSPERGEAAVIVYRTTLSGAAEDPPVISTGTGQAKLTVDTVAHSMTIDVVFADLVGTTTAAHIHGPTGNPFSGTAGVITPVPTFPGFPLGVTSGTYARSFDLLTAATYNPAFLSLQGSAADAEAALLAALAGGRAYLNIHTTFAGGGEIRGFFTPVTPVPTPAGGLLVLTGLAAMAGLRVRRA